MASVTIQAGNSLACTNIEIVDDNILEENEIFLFYLASSDPGIIPDPYASVTIITILDDEG